MNNKPSVAMNNKPSVAMMIVGSVIFVATLGCWLYAETHGVNTGALLAFAVPVVGALFLSGPIGAARDAAQQAAQQTNGSLEARVRAAVSAELAARDAARPKIVVQSTLSDPTMIHPDYSTPDPS